MLRFPRRIAQHFPSPQKKRLIILAISSTGHTCCQLFVRNNKGRELEAEGSNPKFGTSPSSSLVCLPLCLSCCSCCRCWEGAMKGEMKGAMKGRRCETS